MNIWLGLQLSHDSFLPQRPRPALGEMYFSPRAFVQWLEGFYGLTYPSGAIDFLRSEQYRQLCTAYLFDNPDAFFARTFGADQRATATELLSRRDELISAGFPLHLQNEELPPRLQVLAAIERLMLSDENTLALFDGFADRLKRITAAVVQQKHPAFTVKLHEPENLLPPGLKRLLYQLAAGGTVIESIPAPQLPSGNTDLARWQTKINQGGQAKIMATGDGSLVLIKATRETHIAAYLARLLRDNPQWQPQLLLSSRNQTLNDALSMEGLPDLGVAVSSLGRPSLQVLKLVTVFLWEPIDLRKVMEFLNLIVKPLDDHLAVRLARTLADTPGLASERWFATVHTYFNETLPERLNYDKSLDAATIRAQFDLWFNRKRYPQDALIPKAEVRRIFSYLLEWARNRATDLTGANQAVQLVLAAQAERIVELIDTLPENELSYLETERLVRTVYEPAATTFREKEVGSLPTCYAPASIYGAVDELIWWDFIEQEPNYFFSRWTIKEREFLAENGIELFTPVQQNDRLVWQQERPVLHARNRLVLCLPSRVNGDEALPHPLLGELEAAFGEEGLEKITLNVDAVGQGNDLLTAFNLPEFTPEPVHPLSRPKATIRVSRTAALAAREYETPTSLEKLFYYPYQWVFQYRIGLRSNDILDIAADNRLRGNLAHRLIEKMLNSRGQEQWERKQVNAWIDQHFDGLLRQEGAVLLEYGREPEKVQFLNIARYAAWSLVDMIQRNHWEVAATEQEVNGSLEGVEVKGRSDLELTRNGGKETAIVDLKWRGKSTFRNIVKSQEDLQLCLYADFASSIGHVVHTAYFIIQDGLMIGRNNLAFQEIDAISPDLDHEEVGRAVNEKMGKTYQWRRTQLADGIVEIRCEATAGILEDEQLGNAMDELLEMKKEDARFDHYRALIGLVR